MHNERFAQIFTKSQPAKHKLVNSSRMLEVTKQQKMDRDEAIQKYYTLNILSFTPPPRHSLKAMLLFLPISVISIARAEREKINWGRWVWMWNTEKEQATTPTAHLRSALSALAPERRTLHYQEDCWQPWANNAFESLRRQSDEKIKVESSEEEYTALDLTLSEQVRTCVFLAAVTSVDIQMSTGLNMKLNRTGYSTPRERS